MRTAFRFRCRQSNTKYGGKDQKFARFVVLFHCYMMYLFVRSSFRFETVFGDDFVVVLLAKLESVWRSASVDWFAVHYLWKIDIMWCLSNIWGCQLITNALFTFTVKTNAYSCIIMCKHMIYSSNQPSETDFRFCIQFYQQNLSKAGFPSCTPGKGVCGGVKFFSSAVL